MKANVTSKGKRQGSHTFESLDSVHTVHMFDREDVTGVKMELVIA